MHQGTPAEAERFLASRWKDASTISDPDRRLFGAFGLGRGGMRAMFGLGVWREALKNTRYGVGVSMPVGDPFVLAGSFVVHEGEVLVVERAETAATLPNLPRLFDAAAAFEAGVL